MGSLDPLENSNGTSWPRLCEPRRYHRIPRVLSTATARTRVEARQSRSSNFPFLYFHRSSVKFGVNLGRRN